LLFKLKNGRKKTKNINKMVSIIEVENALKQLHFEVESTKGIEAWELLRKYVDQQREKQIKEGTLIVEKSGQKN
jgi:hypothetical protein